MIIYTNEEAVHDSIKYRSIESQLYEILICSFRDVSYTIEGIKTIFILNGRKIRSKIDRKSVVLSFHEFGMYNHFNTVSYPKTILKYNQDISRDIKNFVHLVESVIEVEERHHNLPQIDYEKIRQYIKNQIDSDYFEVNVAENKLGTEEIAFFVYPKNETTSSVLLCFEKTNYEISIYWNNSTELRTRFYKDKGKIETLDNLNKLMQCEFKDDKEMVKHINEVERLKNKLKDFKINEEMKDILSIIDKKHKINLILKRICRK